MKGFFAILPALLIASLLALPAFADEKRPPPTISTVSANIASGDFDHVFEHTVLVDPFDIVFEHTALELTMPADFGVKVMTLPALEKRHEVARLRDDIYIEILALYRSKDANDIPTFWTKIESLSRQTRSPLLC